MTDVTTQPARTAYDGWGERRWRLTGGFLGLLVVLVAALLVTTGEKHSDYGDLLGAVARGEVSEVAVVGLDGEQWQGRRTVELRWTATVDRYAEVVVVRDADAPPSSARRVVTDRDPRAVLRAIDPDIRLTSASYAGGSSSFMDWRVAGPAALLALVAWLSVLLLLVGGPEPWRATRWAWAWIVLLCGPLGSLAYLLIGGPLGLLRPHSGHRRLTGGWAFLLAWVLFAGWREANGW